MATSAPTRPLAILLRDLLLALVVGLVLFVIFEYFNQLVFGSLAQPLILLIEAGAIILIAYMVARAVSGATNALLRRQGTVSRSHAVRLFLNLLIAVGAVLALFKLAGVSIESIFLGSALAGIVLGLAAQTVLANVFAGLLLVLADPFRPGDRVTIVSSSYGAVWPSYPHELTYPGVSGVVEDVGLIYTVLNDDLGRHAKVPNSVVLGALVFRPRPGVPQARRVRMTFPLSVPVATVETVVAQLSATLSPAGGPPPRLEVADIAPTTWDGVIVVWTSARDEAATRDAVLRGVLASHPGAARPS